MMTKVTSTNLSTEQQELLRDAFDKIKFKLDFGIDAEDEEASKTKLEARIYAKLEAGKRLSSKEMQYLRQNNPVLYMQAVRVEQKRKSLENQLEHAKSKEEVQNIYTFAMARVSKEDPAKKYVIAAIEDTVKEFKASDKYKRLPETEEQAEDKYGSGKGNNCEFVYEAGEKSYQIAYAPEEVELSFHAVV